MKRAHEYFTATCYRRVVDATMVKSMYLVMFKFCTEIAPDLHALIGGVESVAVRIPRLSVASSVVSIVNGPVFLHLISPAFPCAHNPIAIPARLELPPDPMSARIGCRHLFRLFSAESM